MRGEYTGHESDNLLANCRLGVVDEVANVEERSLILDRESGNDGEGASEAANENGTGVVAVKGRGQGGHLGKKQRDNRGRCLGEIGETIDESRECTDLQTFLSFGLISSDVAFMDFLGHFFEFSGNDGNQRDLNFVL